QRLNRRLHRVESTRAAARHKNLRKKAHMPASALATHLATQRSASQDNRRPLYKATLNVVQGDCTVISDPSAALTTVLGSCIAACVRDPEVRVGGMNHFLLPADRGDQNDASLRYGCYAMEALINQVLQRGSGRRESLEIKVFGGANVNAGLGHIGHANADFVEDFIRRERLRIVSSDLRGAAARKVLFHPVTGRAFVKHVGGNQSDLVREELATAKTALDTISGGGDDAIELF
ncbi:MAG: hypothetical protein AAF638_12185, partial [Pseudomonadota bacterium]